MVQQKGKTLEQFLTVDGWIHHCWIIDKLLIVASWLELVRIFLVKRFGLREKTTLIWVRI